MIQPSNDGFTPENERDSLSAEKDRKEARKRIKDPLYDYRHTGDTGQDAWNRAHSGWND